MDFRALLAGRGWLHYAAFDVLWLNGRDLRAQSLIKRKRRLEQLIPANNPDPLARARRGRAWAVSCSKRPSRWISRASWQSTAHGGSTQGRGHPAPPVDCVSADTPPPAVASSLGK
jgi:hypothetical protein